MIACPHGFTHVQSVLSLVTATVMYISERVRTHLVLTGPLRKVEYANVTQGRRVVPRGHPARLTHLSVEIP